MSNDIESTLSIAAKAGFTVNLIVSDGVQLGVRVPLKDIINQVSTSDTNGSVVVSYSKLRSIALTSLFRYQGGKVPLYAEKNFETKFTTTLDHAIVTLSNDVDLSQVLTKVAEENLMDDNDSVILDIYCKFVNNWQIVDDLKMKNIRKQASTTANNVLKTLTEWIHKASTVFHKPVECSDDLDYVVLGNKEQADVVQDKNITSKNDWASRMVHLIFSPKAANEPKVVFSENDVDHKTRSLGQDFVAAFDSVTFFANDIMTEIWCRNGELMSQITDHYHHRSSNGIVTTNTGLKSEISVEDSEDLDRGVEILYEYQPSDENAPEEWKVFFTNQIESDTVFIGHPIDDPNMHDTVYLSASNVDDVMSMSSEEDYILDDDEEMDEATCTTSNCDNWELL